MSVFNPRLLLILSALSFSLFSGSVSAELRVATVDINRVINESSEAKAQRKKLDQLSSKAKNDIEARQSELQKREQSLKAANVTADSKEAERFRNDAREFGRFVKDTQEDIQKEFAKSNKELTEKALTLIRGFAAKNKIDIVLDKAEAGRGPVLYSGKTFDITDDIVADID